MKSAIVSERYDVRTPDHTHVQSLINLSGISHYSPSYEILYLHLPNPEQVSPPTADQTTSSDFSETRGASLWPRRSVRYGREGPSCQHDLQINA